MPAEPVQLNISHVSADAALQETLDRIDEESTVSDALGDDGLQGVVERTVVRLGAVTPFRLDLIAHSRDGVLRMRSWDVDDNNETRDLYAAFVDAPNVRLRQLRLLGCNTAVTAAGRSAMLSLAGVFGVRVFGTTVPISAEDFDQTGFTKENFLISDNDLPSPYAPTIFTVEARVMTWFTTLRRAGLDLGDALARLRVESLREVQRDCLDTSPAHRWETRQVDMATFRACFDQLVDDVAQVSGLLALPEQEVVVRVPDAGFHRLTLLLDGNLVRIYSRARARSLVVRVADRAALRALVARGDLVSLPI